MPPVRRKLAWFLGLVWALITTLATYHHAREGMKYAVLDISWVWQLFKAFIKAQLDIIYDPIFRYVFGIFLLYVAVVLSLKAIARVRGDKAGSLSLRALIGLINPVRYYRVIREIHTLEHSIDRAKLFLENIRSESLSYMDCRVVQEVMIDILKVIQRALMYAFNTDIAIHIKMFEGRHGISEVTAPGGNYLVTVARCKSGIECKNEGKGSPARRSNEKFQIIMGDAGRPEGLKNTHPSQSNGDNNRVNSAYCYVFNENDHFWVNNDLTRAEAEGKYYSTSRNWKTFYKSLAVFLISEPRQPGLAIDLTPYGLMIIDSAESGVFDFIYMKLLGGYFAHRLHDVCLHWESLNGSSEEEEDA